MKDPEKDPNDIEKARKLARDYASALERRRGARELATLRKSAAEIGARESIPGEAEAAAQAVIALRRGAR
jgi:hypothetical protein